MKKVQLKVEELHVQSYPTTGAEWAEGGTVHGQQVSGVVTCASACSATDGVRVCKTCGPCC